MIKVVNTRRDGRLYHYAHFICDCLFPEVINEIYKYKKVVREKSLFQTIGNFDKFYTKCMGIKNVELPKKEFDKLKDVTTMFYKNKKHYTDKTHFEKFRKYIFSRYKIRPLVYDAGYPEVILIKRADRVQLLNDKKLIKQNANTHTATSGKERREIDDVDGVEEYLQKKYGDKFKSVYFENLPFKKQIQYFNNAKLIICAHGAVMSNMFFCKKNTKIIEVTCKTGWGFFNEISRILNLNHIKCRINTLEEIVKCIDLNPVYSGENLNPISSAEDRLNSTLDNSLN